MRRHASPRRTAPLRVIPVVALLFAAGCEVREDYTLNPDGSGRVAFEIRNLPDHFLTNFPTAHLRPGATLPTGEQRLWATLIRQGRPYFDRISALEDLEAGLDGGGRAWLKGVAYFDRLDPVVAVSGSGTPISYAVPVAERAGERLIVEVARETPFSRPVALAAGEVAPVPELDDETERAWVAFQRPRWRRKLEQALDDGWHITRDITVRLPGAAVDPLAGFDPAPAAGGGGGTAFHLAFDSRDAARALLARLDDDAFWRDQLRQGHPMNENDIGRLAAEATPTATASVRAPADAAPAFDYAEAVKRATEHPNAAVERLLASGPFGASLIPRLAAGERLPVSVMSANLAATTNNWQIAFNAGNAPRPPSSDAPPAQFGRHWRVTLVGAPIPARAYMVESAAVTEAVDPFGRPLIDRPGGAVVSAMLQNAYPHGYPSPYLANANPPRAPNERVPHVTINLPSLDLPLDRPRVGRIAGRVNFRTYDKEDILRTDLFTPEAGATAKAADETSGVELVAVDETGTRLTGKAWFPAGTFMDAVALGENDAMLASFHTPPEHGGERNRQPGRAGAADFTLRLRTRPAGRVRLALRTRHGERLVAVPFVLADVDLLNPPDLKIPGPGQATVGDANDTPDEAPDARVPRLAARRDMPVGLASASYDVSALNVDTARALGVDAPTGEGWTARLYGAPIPARTLAVRSIKLTEFKPADGEALDASSLAVFASTANNPYFIAATGAVPPRRAEDLAFRAVAPVPALSIRLPRLPLDRDRTRIASLAGVAVLGTFAGEREVDLGELKLERGQKLARYALEVTQEGNNRRWIGMTLRLAPERFAGVAFKADGRTYRPASTPNARSSDGGKTISLDMHFDTAPPASANVILTVRAGLRDVEVPFRLADFDLDKPGRLPDPFGDGKGVFVDDPDDAAEVAALLAAADPEDPDEAPEGPAAEAADVAEPAVERVVRVPRLAVGEPLPMAVRTSTFNANALTPDAAKRLGLDFNTTDFRGRTIRLYGGPLPARTYKVDAARITHLESADGTRVPVEGVRFGHAFNQDPGRRRPDAADDAEVPPMVEVYVNALPLAPDQTKFARIAGTVAVRTFARERRIDLGVVAIKDGAPGKARGLVMRGVRADRREASFQFDGDPETFLDVEVKVGDRVLKPTTPTYGYTPRQDGQGRVIVQRNFAEALPDEAALTLVERVGVRASALPFELTDVDLNDPKPLPDPRKVALFVGDAEDQAAAQAVPDEATQAIPRLAANRPLPVAVQSATFTLPNPGLRDEPWARRYMGAGPRGLNLTLYATPLPARALSVKESKLAEVTLPGGEAVDVPPNRISANILNNPYDPNQGMNRRRFGGMGQPEGAALPLLMLQAMTLPVPYGQAKLGSVAGSVTFRTFGEEKATELGELQLRAEAALDARGLTVRSVNNDRRSVQLQMNGTRESFVKIAFLDDAEREYTPQWSNANDMPNGRIQIQCNFNEPPPERVTVFLTERIGLRDVEVPFRLEDIDLLDLKPLPAPWDDAGGKFVDDEEDRAEAMEAVRAEFERQAEAAERRGQPAPEPPPAVPVEIF